MKHFYRLLYFCSTQWWIYDLPNISGSNFVGYSHVITIISTNGYFEKLERWDSPPARRSSNADHSSRGRLPTARTRMKSRGCWNPRIYRRCTSYQAASRHTARRLASRRDAFPDTLRWRVVTSRDKRQRGCYFQRRRRCQSDAARHGGREKGKKEPLYRDGGWRKRWRCRREKGRATVWVYDARKEIGRRYHRSHEFRQRPPVLSSFTLYSTISEMDSYIVNNSTK